VKAAKGLTIQHGPKCAANFLPDVGKCPINETHQDGHHQYAVLLKKLMEKRPEMESELARWGEFYLWINWHAGPLGHEVAGNQMAYFHMLLMQRAISKLLTASSETLNRLPVVAAPAALPPALYCNEFVCGPFKPLCAWAYLPKRLGPDVGDIMINDSGTSGWKEDIRGPTSHKPCFCQVEKPPQHCMRGCSYTDIKRGFWGTHESGPLSLGFPDMYRCIIVIRGLYYPAKPGEVANWEKDLDVKVDGKDCTRPSCLKIIGKTDLWPQLRVDARDILGSACRKQKVRVDIHVTAKGKGIHVARVHAF